MKLKWWDSWDGRDPRLLADDGIEVWAKVPQAQQYAVSNMGRVASCARGSWKLLTLHTTGAGYRSVGFRTDEGARNGGGLVHRLAVLAFDGPPPTPRHVDVRHLDGDKGNNALSNLRHGTRQENMLDVLRHRRKEKEEAKRVQTEAAEEAGTWYGGRSWDTELVEKVLALERESYITRVQAADLLGVTTHVVGNIIQGNSHLHLNVDRAKKKQKRRSKAQKEAIIALIRKGKNTKQINEALGETLTPQAVYYYKTLLP